MIDKDRIFELFGGEKGKEPENIEELITAEADFLQNPTAKLGMFTKMVHNHEVFHAKLKKFFQQEKASFNAKDTAVSDMFNIRPMSLLV